MTTEENKEGCCDAEKPANTCATETVEKAEGTCGTKETAEKAEGTCSSTTEKTGCC